MPHELDDYATFRERLADTRRHLSLVGDELHTAALRAPNSYTGQPTLSAALLDLRGLERRLQIAILKAPQHEQEATQP